MVKVFKFYTEEIFMLYSMKVTDILGNVHVTGNLIEVIPDIVVPKKENQINESEWKENLKLLTQFKKLTDFYVDTDVGKVYLNPDHVVSILFEEMEE